MATLTDHADLHRAFAGDRAGLLVGLISAADLAIRWGGRNGKGCCRRTIARARQSGLLAAPIRLWGKDYYRREDVDEAEKTILRRGSCPTTSS
jgi:hypothetical protein